MSDTMRKSVITCEVKEIAPRVLRFIASDETIDRSGDVIRAAGWKLDNFMKNPVCMWAHDYSNPPIGRVVNAEVKGKKLIEDVEFADKDTYEFADTIYRLYKGGFLKAVSVGFTPLDWEGKAGNDDLPNWGGNVFTSQDQLELSGCPVPCNPNALVQAKSQKIITAKELKLLAKAMDKFAEEEKQEIKEAEVPENPKEKEISQADIADEIDYLSGMIDKVGISPENTELFKSKLMPGVIVEVDPVIEQAREILAYPKGIPGSHMPVDIKAGAVLNKRNKECLNQIKELAQEVLDSANMEEPEEPEEEPNEEPEKAEPTADEIFEAVKQAIIEIKGE